MNLPKYYNTNVTTSMDLFSVPILQLSIITVLKLNAALIVKISKKDYKPTKKLNEKFIPKLSKLHKNRTYLILQLSVWTFYVQNKCC